MALITNGNAQWSKDPGHILYVIKVHCISDNSDLQWFLNNQTSVLESAASLAILILHNSLAEVETHKSRDLWTEQRKSEYKQSLLLRVMQGIYCCLGASCGGGCRSLLFSSLNYSIRVLCGDT